ncbi:MAG: hypothetical protein IT353_03815 [Gemmatimonadaceae bacterium]|nr:hypothetical protein [Gemmatimonadaceae bacterium]
MTDAYGVAKLDSLPMGEYRIAVRRIGYVSAVVSIAVVAGCREDLELYIPPDAVGLVMSPRMPHRATLTACGAPQ